MDPASVVLGGGAGERPVRPAVSSWRPAEYRPSAESRSFAAVPPISGGRSNRRRLIFCAVWKCPPERSTTRAMWRSTRLLGVGRRLGGLAGAADLAAAATQDPPQLCRRRCCRGGVEFHCGGTRHARCAPLDSGESPEVFTCDSRESPEAVLCYRFALRLAELVQRIEDKARESLPAV